MISVNKKVLVFMIGDGVHPQTNMIYEILVLSAY